VLSDADGRKYKARTSAMTQHELIYWGWTQHLYVMTTHVNITAGNNRLYNNTIYIA